MIEKFISYSDLLALLLAIAISGLIIFFMFFIGFMHSEAEHVGSDSDIEAEAGIETDLETDLESGFHMDSDTDIDTDIDHDFDHDFDHDIDHDFDSETDFDHELDTDVTEVEVDHDMQLETDHEITTGSDLHIGLDAHVGGELVKSIETDGGGSLFAQIGAFCLAFGLFGFFFVLSLGPAQSSELINKLDISVLALFILGVVAYKLSNKVLKALTKGSISPISEVTAGQQITVVSQMIDYQNQGRVLVATPDGEKIMMAISDDVYDMFYEGDKGVVLQSGTPLRISKGYHNSNHKLKSG